jgi:hypothetical protein
MGYSSLISQTEAELNSLEESSRSPLIETESGF